MSSPPVVLLTYRRSDHLQQVIDSLRACHGFNQHPCIVYCDGARSDEDRDDVEAVRSLVRRELPHAVRVERSHNLGLARSMISGVASACRQYGAAIVLEDDCEPSRSFLNDMTWALEEYDHDPRVMHIAGYGFPTQALLPETFFLRPAAGACWGWATWGRAWEAFEQDEEVLLTALNRSNGHYEFNLRKSTRFSARLKVRGRKRDQSWATRWYASIFLNDGLCLRFRDSRIRNLGQDGSGEHALRSDAFDVSLCHEVARSYPVHVAEDERALEAAIEFHRSLRPNYAENVAARAPEAGEDEEARRERLRRGLPGRPIGGPGAR